MTKNPLVTIITATYNAEKFLRDSIQSVVHQTYRNFEYIIVDGASTDGTVEILREFNSNISKWISEPDSGLYDAWNKGIAESKGEWILFIGADDLLLPNALETYIEFINQNSSDSYDYISSKVQRINPDGSIESIVGKKWNWSAFRKRMTTAHPGSFHSKQLFDAYGSYSTKYKIVSDYEILLRPREKLRAGFIDQITVLMSTGGRFNANEAMSECLRMFKDSAHLNNFTYRMHLADIKVRKFVKTLLHYFK